MAASHADKHHASPAAPASGQPRRPAQGQMIAVRVVGRPDSLEQRIYLPEVVKGAGRHRQALLRQPVLPQIHRHRRIPEQKVKYPPRNRGLHRLMHREDGEVRCVACMLCPTVCPAHCITIVPEETGSGNEKRPKVFEIDELRCVVCGLCGSLSCDAIRMGHRRARDSRRFPRRRHPRQAGPAQARRSFDGPHQGGVGGEWRQNADKTHDSTP